MKNRVLNLVTRLAIALLCFTITSCKEDAKKIKQVVVTFKKEGELTLKRTNDSIIKTLDIEIADNDYQTQTGLMYRDGMKDSQGMLFVFPRAEYHSFYMKNTRFALDIIYIDSDKNIVSFQKNAQPFNETSLPSEAPCQYVLEINAGLSDQWNLEVGDAIDFKML